MLKKIKVDLTVGTDTYTAQDNVGGLITFPVSSGYSGDNCGAIIRGIVITDEAAQSEKYHMHFFNADPTAGCDTDDAEFVPVATLIYQTSSSYGNTPKARLVSNDEGSAWTDWRESGLTPVAGSSTDHGSLSGLGNDDHLQYARLTGLRPFNGNQEFQSGI